MLFPALASIFKEKIFTETKAKLGGKQLDLFVVNSFGSGAQAVCVFLLLPFLASLRGISFGELPTYLAEGAPRRRMRACGVQPESRARSMAAARKRLRRWAVARKLDWRHTLHGFSRPCVLSTLFWGWQRTYRWEVLL
jgi:hypothetical protein